MKILVTGSEKKVRDEQGRFSRIHDIFSLENFEDGYIDKYGRFKVYLPNHPRSNRMGYVFRSIVAYEIYHNVPVPRDFDVHHEDGNRLNDSKKNLILIKHDSHTSLHRNETNHYEVRICKTCKIEFWIKKGRLKDPSRGQYCSQKCYHKSRVGLRRNLS